MILLMFDIQHRCFFEPNMFAEIQDGGTLWKRMKLPVKLKPICYLSACLHFSNAGLGLLYVFY